MDTAAQLLFWTQLLQLTDFRVSHVHQDPLQKRILFTLSPQHEFALCPHCQHTCQTVKQQRTREDLHDLPIGPHQVRLRIRVNQYPCEHCAHTFTPPTAFVAEGAHATERFLERAAQLIRTSDVSNAAKFLGVPERTLDRWYLAWVERQQIQSAPTPEQPIRRIGIDELSLKKSSDNSSP